jgi:putative nucleotidyltransferase with HDIG domain
MPLNKKYVTFSHGGDQLSEDRAEKLAQHKITSVFVPQDQMQKFYEYTAARLKDLSTNQKMSETERRDKLQGAVRDLISGIFNGETVSAGSGKQVIEDCQKIVSTFILSSTKSDWYSKILSITSDTSNTYSHAANTSTFASLFSIALGIGNPEELALAGLLHDIGMAKVPIEIQNKRPEEWTPEEKAIYEKHPEHTIDIIKERKLIVSENVHKMILQHHEKFSGTGFPKQLSGKKILIEAQILSLADIFDELTAIIEGKAQISPADAFKSMKMTAASDPGNQAVDPDLLAKVGNLFLSEENKKIA